MDKKMALRYFGDGLYRSRRLSIILFMRLTMSNEQNKRQ